MPRSPPHFESHIRPGMSDDSEVCGEELILILSRKRTILEVQYTALVNSKVPLILIVFGAPLNKIVIAETGLQQFLR